VIGVVPEEKSRSMEIESTADNKPKGKVLYAGDLQVKTRRDFMEVHESIRKGQCIFSRYI